MLKQLLFTDKDPGVETAGPVANIKEIQILVIFEHDLHRIDEKHALLHIVDVLLDLGHFVISALKSVNVV